MANHTALEGKPLPHLEMKEDFLNECRIDIIFRCVLISFYEGPSVSSSVRLSVGP